MEQVNQRQFAVVTGASSGIGFELAKQFAQNGFDLLVVAEGERIKDAATDLAQLGVKVDSIQANLATHEGVHEVLSDVQSANRPLDAIAINAGVGVSGRFMTQIWRKSWTWWL
jgi:short-subunit dehydrogenase